MRPLWSVAALAPLLFSRPAHACATAPPEGVFVQIAEESALIVYDAEARREHFIRRASFRAAGRDFGFLVPTPDKPELAEVPDEVFDRLEQATKPDVVHRTEISGVEPTLLLGTFLMRGRLESAAAVASAEASAVRVLDAQRVAGYDAVVLEADSPSALASWLKDHGYAERQELSAWLTPYVEKRWKLTAFKIAPAEGAQAVATNAVRMSFTTDRPFFPYREPADQREVMPASAPALERERLLRVFFVGKGRVDGAIGEARAPWPGKAIWSSHYNVGRMGALPVPAPEGAWMTMFEDRASPRPGTDDLFFAPAADPRPVLPPPVVLTQYEKIPLPLDVIGGGALIAFWAVRRVRRRERPKAS